ncbi:hypothetical protein MUK42_16691, partial [Musa troglodytarum]
SLSLSQRTFSEKLFPPPPICQRLRLALNAVEHRRSWSTDSRRSEGSVVIRELCGWSRWRWPTMTGIWARWCGAAGRRGRRRRRRRRRRRGVTSFCNLRRRCRSTWNSRNQRRREGKEALLWVGQICSGAVTAFRSWRSSTSPSSPKSSSSSSSRGGVRRALPLPLWWGRINRRRPVRVSGLPHRSPAPNEGRISRRRWCATSPPTGSPPMYGRGGSTARNPSKALLILGDTTGVAVRRVALLANRWSAARLTRPCTSSPIPLSTTTRCPLTATPWLAAPATSSLLLPLPRPQPEKTVATHPQAPRRRPPRRVSPQPPPSRPPWRTATTGRSRRRTKTKKCYWWRTWRSWASRTCSSWAARRKQAPPPPLRLRRSRSSSAATAG